MVSSYAVIPNVSTLKHNKWNNLLARRTPCSVNILVQRTFKQNLKQSSIMFSKIKEIYQKTKQSIMKNFSYIMTNENLEKIYH